MLFDIQPKKKRKFRDSLGNEIPASEIAELMSGGKRVIYYREDKVDGESKDKVVSIGKYGKVSWSDLM